MYSTSYFHSILQRNYVLSCTIVVLPVSEVQVHVKEKRKCQVNTQLLNRSTVTQHSFYRSALAEMRITAQYIANNPKCPHVIKSVIEKLIKLISSFAPAVVPIPNQPSGSGQAS